jgi:hypothetical protein
VAGMQSTGMTPKTAQQAAVVFEFRNDLPSQLQEVMLEEPDDMEAIGHDPCVGKPSAHQRPVRAREIDTDHFDRVPPSQTAQKPGQLALAATRHDVKNAAVLAAELYEIVSHVFADGSSGNSKDDSDLSIPFAVGNPTQDLYFTGSKRIPAEKSCRHRISGVEMR